jgi:cytoskeletal protein CcmA (bactofilin family)
LPRLGAKERDLMQPTAGIGPSIHIKGTISTQEPITIAGHVTGSIDASGHAVTIVSTASIDGDVMADGIEIGGRAHGRLQATSRINVHDTATIEGTVATPVICVAMGAEIKAECQIDGRRPTSLPLAS